MIHHRLIVWWHGRANHDSHKHNQKMATGGSCCFLFPSEKTKQQAFSECNKELSRISRYSSVRLSLISSAAHHKWSPSIIMFFLASQPYYMVTAASYRSTFRFSLQQCTNLVEDSQLNTKRTATTIHGCGRHLFLRTEPMPVMPCLPVTDRLCDCPGVHFPGVGFVMVLFIW